MSYILLNAAKKYESSLNGYNHHLDLAKSASI